MPQNERNPLADFPGLKDMFEKTINTEDPKCTCKEFSKQRALCPVCDKEEFETMRQLNERAKAPLKEFNEGQQYLQENEKQIEEITTAVFKEISSSVNKHGPMPEDLIHRAGIVCEESGELVRACINLVYETNENGKNFDQFAKEVREANNEVYKEAIHTAATAIKFLLSLQKR